MTTTSPTAAPLSLAALAATALLLLLAFPLLGAEVPIGRIAAAYAEGSAGALQELWDGPMPPVLRRHVMNRSRGACATLAGFAVDGEANGEANAEANGELLVRVSIRRGTTIADEHLAIRFAEGKIAAIVSRELELSRQIANAAPDVSVDALVDAHRDLVGPIVVAALRDDVLRLINVSKNAEAVRALEPLAKMAALSGDPASEALALDARSVVLRRLRLAGALEAAEEAMRFAEQSGDADVIAKAILDRARIRMERSGYAGAELPALLRVIELADRQSDSIQVGRAAGLASEVYEQQGEFQKALRYAELVRTLAASSRDVLGLFSAEMALGTLHGTLNDLRTARAHYRAAAEWAVPIDYVAGLAWSYSMLAETERELGMDAQALDTAANALALLLKLDVPELTANVFGTTGRIYAARGDYERAEILLEQERQLAHRGFEMVARAAAYEHLAALRLQQKRYAEARDLACVALELRTGAQSTAQPDAWILAARAERALGHRRRARAMLEEALLHAERQRGSVVDGRQRRLFFSTRAGSYNDMADLLLDLGNVEGALLAAENAKARTLLDLRSDRPVPVPARTLDNLAAGIPDDAVAIEYAISGDAVHRFTVRRSSGKTRLTVRKLPIGARALQRKTDTLRARIGARDLRFATLARELHGLLLGTLPAATRLVVIVPDGFLAAVPYDALISGQGRFVAEETATVMVPSLAVLRHMQTARRASRAPRAFLGIGNPRTTAAFAPLPDAQREIAAAARLFRAPTIHIGSDATEERVRSEAVRHRVLHFATHAILDDRQPLRSRLVLAGGSALEAEEILELPLDADLVVLSACETARGGGAPGEGLMGMAWSVLAAGGRSTLATHWSVGSAASADLVIAFYERWRAQPQHPFARAAALQHARRQLIAQRASRHPYYWAGFVLIGSF